MSKNTYNINLVMNPQDLFRKIPFVYFCGRLWTYGAPTIKVAIHLQKLSTTNFPTCYKIQYSIPASFFTHFWVFLNNYKKYYVQHRLCIACLWSGYYWSGWNWKWFQIFFCLLAKIPVIRVGGDPPNAENRVGGYITSLAKIENIAKSTKIDLLKLN